MKTTYTTLAAACSVALISAASAQNVHEGEATQHPYPSTESQEIYPVPDVHQTPPGTTMQHTQPLGPGIAQNQAVTPDSQRTQPVAPNVQQEQPVRPDAQQEQPVRPDAQSTTPDTDMTTQTTALTEDEQDFLENAIQGSYAEIEGSQLALAKTEDPEVRDFAQMMIDDHQKMVSEASALATKKGLTPPDGPSVMQVTEVTALKALTGGAFDAMYVNRIGVAAHESTVQMFEEARQNVQDAELQTMISETLPKLQEHLRMAQALNEKQENQ